MCISWRRQWHPTPVLLPRKSHGPRSLLGCSPGGREESDMTERLHFHFSLSCTGEGNGNPLQCSCLENPRDRGTWWAAVYGAVQSRTWLKWLSSSSILWWRRIRCLWKLPDGRDWLRGKLGLVLMGEAMLSKSLIQFSVDGWGWKRSVFIPIPKK